MNLVKANQHRANLIGEMIIGRLVRHEEWIGATSWGKWNKKQGLEGIRFAPAVLIYQVKDCPTSFIYLRDPELINVESLDLGDPSILRRHDPEIESDFITNDGDAPFKRTVSKTFSKIKTLSQGFKIGAEESLKATASFEGFGGEIAAKLTQEYSQTWGETETQSNTVTEELTVPAHSRIDYEASREVVDMEREVKAYADFTYFVRIVADDQFVLHDTKWEDLKSIMLGEAPANYPLYELFRQYPLSKQERKRLLSNNQHNIKFMAEYQNVNKQSISIKNVA